MIGCPNAQIEGLNTSALRTRLELYVNEKSWKVLDEETQIELNILIYKAKEIIVPTL